MLETYERKKFILACLSCALLPLAIYSGSLNAPFIFDDFDNIVHNADVQNLGQLCEKMKRVLGGEKLFFERVYWARPLTFFSFGLTYQLSGLNPYGHHLFNVFIHAAATLLLFFLTLKIFRLLAPGSGYAIPLVVALVFSAHPMNTDAVTFISNRSDAIATCFYFLALFSFIKMAERGRDTLVWGAASAFSFILAFGTKEIAATFPLMVLLFDWIFLCDFDRKRLTTRGGYHALYWLILAAAVFFRASYSKGVGYMFPFSFGWTNSNYLFTQFYVIANYMRLLVLPLGQSLDHWITPFPAFLTPKVFVSFIALAALTGGSVYVFRKSPLYKLLLFSVLWFFITLTPTSSFLPINDAMVERRVYLPMWGFLLWALCLLLKALGQDLNLKPGKKFITLAAACVFIFSAFTVRRNALYHDPLNLWKEAAAMYPDNYRAQYNAANILYGRDGNFEEAKYYYQKTIALNSSLFEPNLNMGVMLAREKKFEAALPFFMKARAIRSDYAECAFNLGVLYKDWGDYPKSLQFCEETIRLDPHHEGALRAIPWIKEKIRG